jgi:E3 SUMO-protein ligase PIAS1
MTHHRHTVKVPLRPQDYPILGRVQTDQNLKVMVFCGAEGGGKQDIAFPHQSEIKVNGGEIKANLRGLKNKPGSTRPVDITKELRLNIPAYSNNVEMTYALTSKVGGRSEVSFLTPTVYALPCLICFSLAASQFKRLLADTT